jgi:hypothetical protein
VSIRDRGWVPFVAPAISNKNKKRREANRGDATRKASQPHHHPRILRTATPRSVIAEMVRSPWWFFWCFWFGESSHISNRVMPNNNVTKWDTVFLPRRRILFGNDCSVAVPTGIFVFTILELPFVPHSADVCVPSPVFDLSIMVKAGLYHSKIIK